MNSNSRKTIIKYEVCTQCKTELIRNKGIYCKKCRLNINKDKLKVISYNFNNTSKLIILLNYYKLTYYVYIN
jgi:hypothetical protein